MSEFPAKYKGICAVGGDPILPGQEVRYVDEELVHIECIGFDMQANKRHRFKGTTLDEMGY